MATPISVGAHADVTLLNVTVEEFNPDNSWARVNLAPDPVTNEIVTLWLPTDSRINAVLSVPDNWPPLEGDVWGLADGSAQAWVVNDGSGNLYFVTEDNVRTQTTPITIQEALAQFGKQLVRLFTMPAS